MGNWKVWAAIVAIVTWIVVVLVVPGARFITVGIVMVLTSIFIYVIWGREQSTAWKWLLLLYGLLGVGFVFVGLGLLPL